MDNNLEKDLSQKILEQIITEEDLMKIRIINERLKLLGINTTVEKELFSDKPKLKMVKDVSNDSETIFFENDKEKIELVTFKLIFDMDYYTGKMSIKLDYSFPS